MNKKQLITTEDLLVVISSVVERSYISVVFFCRKSIFSDQCEYASGLEKSFPQENHITVKSIQYTCFQRT